MKTATTILGALCVAASALAQTPTATPPPVDYIAQLRGVTPATLTPPMRIAQQTVVRVPLLTGQLFGAIRQFATALWADPTQAQAIVDSLGEKAAPLFIVYGTMAGPLANLDPVTAATLPPVPAGYAWSIVPPQADGTWPVGQRSVRITSTAPPAATPTPAP